MASSEQSQSRDWLPWGPPSCVYTKSHFFPQLGGGGGTHLVTGTSERDSCAVRQIACMPRLGKTVTDCPQFFLELLPSLEAQVGHHGDSGRHYLGGAAHLSQPQAVHVNPRWGCSL